MSARFPGHELRRGLVIPMAVVVGIGVLAAPAATASGVSTASTAASLANSPTIVTLPSGDTVEVSTSADGRQEAALLPGSPDEQFSELHLGGDLYVIPQATIEDSGGSLDLSQYDVTALAATTNGATATPAATGPVTPAMAAFYTITVHGIDAAGQPDTGDGAVLVNVDNPNLFFAFAIFDQGEFKESVPAGTYALLSFFYDSATLTVRVVTQPEFTVAGPTDATLDARTATTPISVTLPQSTDPVEAEVSVDRTAAKGGDASYSFGTGPEGSTWYAAPTQPVSIGDLHYYSYWRSESPTGTTPGYQYIVEFPSDHVIPTNQTYTVTPSQLATQDTSYFADGQPRTGEGTEFSFLPWQTAEIRRLTPINSGMERTEYFTGNPDIIWRQDWYATTAPFRAQWPEFVDSDHHYLAGQLTDVKWLAGPLQPGFQHDYGTPYPFICPACRSLNTLDLQIEPFGDNDVGHLGLPVGGRPSDQTFYTISENGQVVASGTGPLTGSFPISQHTGTYRIAYNSTRPATVWSQSTSTQTEWTFTASAGGHQPKGWVCAGGESTCSPVPLLMARYGLTTNLLGQETGGPTQFSVAIGHIQGAPATAITAVTADVSFDGGTTWTPAQVAGQSGEYEVSYTNPAAADTNGFAAIRIFAQDAAGNTLSQTVLRAYAITP